MLRKLFFIALLFGLCLLFYKSALIKARSYVDQNEKETWAPQVQYYIGNVYFFVRNYADAEYVYKLTKKKYPKSLYASRSQYMIAQIYENLEDYRRAKQEYEKFAKEYPHDVLIKKAKNKVEFFSRLYGGGTAPYGEQ